MWLTIRLVLLAILCYSTQEFTPNRNLKLLEVYFDKEIDAHFDSVSETITHAEITRYGIVRSVTKHFIDKQKHSGTIRVSMNKADSVYSKNLNSLYQDYLSANDYERLSSCDLQLSSAIDEIASAAASIDLDASTKDLPHAHFDAETFAEANELVAHRLNETRRFVAARDYKVARKSLGQALHAIQDFYSHSNWIEMGNDDINKRIGLPNAFDGLSTLSSLSKEMACFDANCTKHVVDCSVNLDRLHLLNEALSLNLPLRCPIVYFKCQNNVLHTHLTSGYYSNQKLSDGSQVIKPTNKSKCSHGGYLDMTSYEQSMGGINKDTPFYFLSPHAHLHTKAAQLAIKHTEYVLDNLLGLVYETSYGELLELFHGDFDSNSFYCTLRKLLFS